MSIQNLPSAVAPNAQRAQALKPYRSPTLVTFGAVAQLTGGMSAGNADGMSSTGLNKIGTSSYSPVRAPTGGSLSKPGQSSGRIGGG